jgi:long-chain acyl-CoA synthetase
VNGIVAGLPKGVQLSHENLAAAYAGGGTVFPHLNPSDVYIAYLPLAHIMEVNAELRYLLAGCSLGYSHPGTITSCSRAIPRPDAQNGVPVVVGDAALLKPTLMAASPKMVQRLRASIEKEVHESNRVYQWLFKIGMKACQAARKSGADSPFWYWLLFDRIRTQLLGGKLRLMISGGGILLADTEMFMTTVLRAPIVQGYGLTETAAAGAVNWCDDPIGGRIGPPVQSVDIKLIDWVEGGYLHTDPNPRGEVYIGGQPVSMGYYKKPQLTQEVYSVDEDGKRWFATGDIAEIMPGGILRIIDRRKDLFKLSNGEYVAPSKIEAAIANSPLVEMSVVHADPTQDNCIAIIHLNQAAVERRFPEFYGCKYYHLS